MPFTHIIVASHDTPGARAAERLALSVLTPGGHLRQLYVVPDLWKGMLGDDWLNNAATQDRFGRYLEQELEGESMRARERLEAEARQMGLEYSFVRVLGKPAEALLAQAQEQTPDLVVIGSPRPKGIPGLRSRMDLKILLPALRLPLLIAPYPSVA